jgi:hypothetical protein
MTIDGHDSILRETALMEIRMGGGWGSMRDVLWTTGRIKEDAEKLVTLEQNLRTNFSRG